MNSVRVEPLVEQIVGLAPRRIGEDGAGAERARPVFHAAGIDRADFAGGEPLRRRRDRVASEAPNPRNLAERGIRLARVIATEIDVVETAPLGKPALEAVALEQIGERAADRQSFVAHRRER